MYIIGGWWQFETPSSLVKEVRGRGLFICAANGRRLWSETKSRTIALFTGGLNHPLGNKMNSIFGDQGGDVSLRFGSVICCRTLAGLSLVFDRIPFPQKSPGLKKFLFPRTVKDWNFLPSSVRSKPCVDSFKTLSVYLASPEVITEPWHSNSNGSTSMAGYSLKSWSHHYHSTCTAPISNCLSAHGFRRTEMAPNCQLGYTLQRVRIRQRRRLKISNAKQQQRSSKKANKNTISGAYD